MTPKKRSISDIYQIKVTLKGSKPPIWRRFQVAGDTSLGELHDIIQTVMGWENYHLHAFTINGQIYGDPADDEYGDLGTKDERRYTLNRLISSPGTRFEYEYDFGDSWEHTLVVEKILPPEADVQYPLCIKGKRACPPEDVGGIWGYEEFLEAIQDPEHPEHEEWLGWSGEFDPEDFDLDWINEGLNPSV